ncbi:MAG TPA: hypothetical protein VGK24_12460, partial [Candidatus Angelobacter sp.]
MSAVVSDKRQLRTCPNSQLIRFTKSATVRQPSGVEVRWIFEKWQLAISKWQMARQGRSQPDS